MEALFGQAYLGISCWGWRDPNPHGPAAVKLLALYGDIKAGIAAQLDAQSQDRELYAALDLNWDEASQSFAFDVSAVVQALRQEYTSDTSAGQANTLAHLQQFARNLKAQGEGGEQMVRALRAAGDAEGDGIAQALLAFGSDQPIFTGTTGNDSLQGNSADNLMYGLGGDDTLVGGEGADEYVFNRGDGQDLILDVGAPGTGSTADVLSLGAGILPEWLTLSCEVGCLCAKVHRRRGRKARICRYGSAGVAKPAQAGWGVPGQFAC